MIIRSYPIRSLILALPFCTAASASIAISDPSLDNQADVERTNGSVPSTWSEPTATVVEVTIPSAAVGVTVKTERALSANPLWGISLKQFSSTRERPIFLPSRRQPAPLASTVTVAKAVAPPKPKEPEQPQLSLVGTISGDKAKFGIFVEQATKNVLRLREGEEFQGWQLRSIQGREASFQNSQLTFVVAVPQPGPAQMSITVREQLATDTQLLRHQ
jgi:hypothetical protein